MKLTNFLYVGALGLWRLKPLRMPPAISLQLASLGVRMWSDRKWQEVQFLRFGCVGRTGGEILMGKAIRNGIGRLPSL